jgi:mono/diheme cytochrome c family protein
LPISWPLAAELPMMIAAANIAMRNFMAASVEYIGMVSGNVRRGLETNQNRRAASMRFFPRNDGKAAMRWRLAAMSGMAAAGIWMSAAMGAAPDTVRRGEIFAQRNCATCHAIGRAGASAYDPAPPFRDLHKRYPVEMLEEALAEGIVVGHTGRRQMPEFRLMPDEIEDLIAYLKSLERR